jgi:hypothetical protein
MATIARSNPTAPNCSNKNKRPNKKIKNQKIKIKSYLIFICNIIYKLQLSFTLHILKLIN